MTCPDARELFSDWADDALTAEERARVDAHLAQCGECRKELERFTATVTLLHRMERPRAPAGFVDRVLGRTQRVPWHRRLFQRLFLPLAVKLPAEAVALLLVAGLAVYVFQRTPELQQAARETLPPASRPPATPLAPPPAAQEAARRGLVDRPRGTATEAENRLMTPAEHAARSGPPEGAKTAPPARRAPAAPPLSPGGVERQVQSSGDSRKDAGTGRAGAPTAPEPPASRDRPALLEQVAKSAAPPVPAAGAAPPAPRPEDAIEAKATDAKKEAEKSRSLTAPPVSPSPPSAARSATAPEGRMDSESDKLARSPARAEPPSPSVARVLPTADVVGRLTVKDRIAAEQALGVLLARSGGVMISRRDDAGTTLVEVAVPRTAYPQFTQGLARLGTWHPEGAPIELPADVRVTLRLVQ